MKIEFKLFASLAEYLPNGTEKNSAMMEVDENTTPNQLIDQYNIPRSRVHLVLVNGVFMDEGARDKSLKPNDTLAIWPPVAGG